MEPAVTSAAFAPGPCITLANIRCSNHLIPPLTALVTSFQAAVMALPMALNAPGIPAHAALSSDLRPPIVVSCVKVTLPSFPWTMMVVLDGSCAFGSPAGGAAVIVTSWPFPL